MSREVHATASLQIGPEFLWSAGVQAMGKASSLLTPRPDRLRIGPEINRGAYGTVYSGTLGGRPVAVKEIHRLLVNYASENEEDLEAVVTGFRREWELLEAAKHPNVVYLVGVFNQDRKVLLVMERVEQTLENFLKNRKGISLKRSRLPSAWQWHQDCCFSTSMIPKFSIVT